MLLMCSGFWCTTAGADVAANRSWCVRTWAVENGLPNNWVCGVAQAPDGFLWIATRERLSRFDGVRFENHSVLELPGLSNGVVRIMQGARDGGLWLGMEEGQIVRYAPDAQPRVFRENLPDHQPDSMVEDKSGAMWIGYHNGPVCRLLDGGVKVFDVNEGVRRGPTASLAIDSGGDIWLARGGRLSKRAGDTFVDVATVPGGRAQIAAGSDGGIWICGAGRVFKFTQATGTREIAALPVKGVAADRAIPFQDSSGTLWVGTSGGGLFRYTGADFEKVVTPQANILRLSEDRAGNLWVATVFGFNRITPRAVALEGADAGLPFGSVNGLSQAKDGTIWAVAGDATLKVRNGDGWQASPVNLSDPVASVLCAVDGTVWIGTKTGKVVHFDGVNLTTFGQAEGIDAHAITVLMLSHGGDLLLGSTSADGLFRLRANAVSKVSLPSSTGRVRAIAEDPTGIIWIACAQGSGGALFKVTDGKVSEQPLGGSTRAIRCLSIGADQSLWIGCDVGMARLKDGRLALITARQGLYEDGVSQIVADGRGWVWLGGDHGISRVREQELNDVADGRAAQLQSFHYGSDEEVSPLQAKAGQSPCALKGADGRIWMPMGTALAVIDPRRVRQHSEAPPVYVERVSRDDVNIARQGEAAIQLPPDYHHLDFVFTAPQFNAPESVRFRYRLEGFEEDWTEVSEPRRAAYPRLPAGKYTFRVTAANADGIWNSRSSDVTFIVVPFFWQTWWFSALALLAFGAAGVLVARFVSLRRLRRRLEILERRSALDRERARIAKDIHDDLGHDLTQIALLSDLTAQHHPTGVELDAHLRQIASTAKQGMKSLDETVWAINPRNDTVADLIDYVGQFAVESLRPAGIRCQLDLPDHPPQRMVASEIRHNLFLAVKEAINNILRHAQASEVKIDITLSGDAMTIVIVDNGRGFASGATESTQDGLRNMNQRMLDVNGSFSVVSSVGAGTRVTLVYPWARETRPSALAAAPAERIHL